VGIRYARLTRRFTPPDERRLRNTTGVSGSPDIMELDDGSIGVIGTDITDRLGRQPLADAKCAPGERIVRIPRNTLLYAAKDVLES
jgi:hypothetical protein